MELHESLLPVLAIAYIFVFVIFAHRNNKSEKSGAPLHNFKKTSWLS
jgi:hypothetical protein